MKRRAFPYDTSRILLQIIAVFEDWSVIRTHISFSLTTTHFEDYYFVIY
jgi:hypothetical protein